jgi:hypothetical protein
MPNTKGHTTLVMAKQEGPALHLRTKSTFNWAGKVPGNCTVPVGPNKKNFQGLQCSRDKAQQGHGAAIFFVCFAT